MKIFKYVVLLMTSAVFFTACEMESAKGETLEPDDVKGKVEDTLYDLLDAYDAENFRKVVNLGERFGEEYGDDPYYDWDQVEEYLEDRGEKLFFSDENYRREGNNIYHEYLATVIVELSDIKGKLTLGPNSARCTDYDGTQVLFSLDGKDYVVDIVPSGKTTTALYEHEEIYGHRYGNEYNHYKDTHHIEIDVPETVSVTITENGKTFAAITMSFTTSFSKNGVSLTKDCFMVTSSILVDNQEMIIEKTGYNAATGKAEMAVTLKKNGNQLLYASASVDAKFNLVTKKDEWSNGYEEYVYPEFSTARNVNLYIDIMGNIQLRGTCSDVKACTDYMENFYEADNEAAAVRALDNINKKLDIALYDQGGKTRQASVVLDYYLYDDYGESWWEVEPILVFGDGSKYAFYEYFTESDADRFGSRFEDWLEGYEDLFD